MTGKPRPDGQGKSDAAQSEGYARPLVGPPVPHKMKVQQTIEKVVKTAINLYIHRLTINRHIARDRCRENHGIPASDQSVTPCDIYIRDDDLGDVAKVALPGLLRTGGEMAAGGVEGKVASAVLGRGRIGRRPLGRHRRRRGTRLSAGRRPGFRRVLLSFNKRVEVGS